MLNKIADFYEDQVAPRRPRRLTLDPRADHDRGRRCIVGFIVIAMYLPLATSVYDNIRECCARYGRSARVAAVDSHTSVVFTRTSRDP
jgi:hypothetical protein